jgi:hypothetical protein
VRFRKKDCSFEGFARQIWIFGDFVEAIAPLDRFALLAMTVAGAPRLSFIVAATTLP